MIPGARYRDPNGQLVEVLAVQDIEPEKEIFVCFVDEPTGKHLELPPPVSVGVSTFRETFKAVRDCG